MQADWALVIRQALKAERAVLIEIVGAALGEIRNETVDELEQMIAQAVEQLRTELRTEFANQADQLRSELSARIDLVHTQGGELRAQLEAVIAKKSRAKAAKEKAAHLLQLPAPNGDAHGPQ